jgi:hypothetical protein
MVVVALLWRYCWEVSRLEYEVVRERMGNL